MAASLLHIPGTAMADASGPDYYRVSGVAPSDVLNMRTGPSVNHPKIGGLPFDANGMANFGCVGGLNLAQWDQATPEERAASRYQRWCLVGFERQIGWVAGWHLVEGGAPDRFRGGVPLNQLAGSEWRLIRLGPTAVDVDRFVTFRSEGRLTGHGGCNRLSGGFEQEGRALSIGPLATTRMQCDQELMDAEKAFLAALETGSRFVARHLVLALLDADNEIVAQFRRTDFD